MSFFNRACVEIDTQALKHNLSILHQAAPSSALLAILKCNAYGHGLVRIAKQLPLQVGIGVACMSEAIQLRSAGITQKIVLLEGCLTQEEYQQASQYDLSPVIHHHTQVAWLKTCSLRTSLEIWVKVNTGMNRLGFAVEEVSTVFAQLKTLSVVKAMVLMSHLSSADQLKSQKTTTQIHCFEHVVQQLNHQDYFLPKSLSNSAALLKWPAAHYQWVRPGLALYGISPFTHATEHAVALRPVMTVKAKLIAIHTLRLGDEVGYYGRFRCPCNMQVGIVSFGYGDGYPYRAPDGTPVLLNNRLAFTVGQVAMDMLTIDLRDHPEASIGDTVTLWGEQLNIAKVAQHIACSCYELLCGIAQESSQRFEIKEIL